MKQTKVDRSWALHMEAAVQACKKYNEEIEQAKATYREKVPPGKAVDNQIATTAWRELEKAKKQARIAWRRAVDPTDKAYKEAIRDEVMERLGRKS